MTRPMPHEQEKAPFAGAAPLLGRAYSSQDWHGLLAVLVLALVLRGLCCGRLACISRDGVHFVTYARQLGDDPVAAMRTTTKQPGFSWLILGLHAAGGRLLSSDDPLAWQRTGQALALIGGVAACGLIFVLSRRLFDTSIATLAGTLAAVWPQGAHLSADVLSDMPHLALYLAAFLLAYTAVQSGRLSRLALSGLVAGLAYMLRQEALGVAITAAVGWVWLTPRISRRRRAVGVAVVALCFAAVVAPYSAAAGKLMPNKNLWQLFWGSPPQAALNSVSAESEIRGMAAAWSGHAPLTASQHASMAAPSRGHATAPLNLASLRQGRAGFSHQQDGSAGASPSLAEAIPWWAAPPRMIERWAKSGRYVIAALFLLALVLKSASRAEHTGQRLAAVAVLLQLIAVQLRIKSYGEISGRYMIIPLVMSVPWAASGLLALLSLISVRLRARWNVRPIDVRTIGVVIAALPMLYYVARPVNHDKAHFRQTGQWLCDNVPADDLVLSHNRLEQLMFYAGRTYPSRLWLQCPESDAIAAVQSRIAQSRPGWFVDSEGSHHGKIDERPYFRALFDGTIPRLQPAFSSSRGSQRAHVFRVMPE